MRIFEVRIAARARELDPMSGREESPLTEHELVVTVYMGDNAKPEDAAAELARRLEKLCDDGVLYEGG